MKSDFTNRGITTIEKNNFSNNMSYIRRILNVVKENKEASIFIGIVAIIILVIIILVNLLSVSVLGEKEIGENLIGKMINVNGKEIEITDSNLDDVIIINRFTEKYETDVVNIEFKVNLDNSKIVEMGTVKFHYANNKWIYSSSEIENIKNIETETSVEDCIQALIQRDGISVEKGEHYYGSSVKKISNIQCGDYSVSEGKEFSADIVISNGVCYQNCHIDGKIIFNIEENSWKIIYEDIIENDTVYKEEKVNLNDIKKIVLDEITDGTLYEYKSGNDSEYININKDLVTELNIKDYIVRDDSTVRLEIDGKAESDKVVDMNFQGFVSISGKLSCGVIRNSKDVKIYGSDKDVTKAESEDKLKD